MYKVGDYIKANTALEIESSGGKIAICIAPQHPYPGPNTGETLTIGASHPDCPMPNCPEGCLYYRVEEMPSLINFLNGEKNVS